MLIGSYLRTDRGDGPGLRLALDGRAAGRVLEAMDEAGTTSRLTAAIARRIAARWAGVPAPAPRLQAIHTARRTAAGTWRQH